MSSAIFAIEIFALNMSNIIQTKILYESHVDETRHTFYELFRNILTFMHFVSLRFIFE
jgi:hypothetical protein